MPFSIGEVAWYGAIVATFTLLFNVWKYSRERARLQVRIVRTWYPNGGFSKVETTEHGEVKTANIYFHIEVTNVGERPTTIMGVCATTEPSGPVDRWRQRNKGVSGYIFQDGSGFTVHYGKQLPHVLNPGEVWSCRLLENRIDTLYRAGQPKLELAAACFRKPRLFRFPPIKRGGNP